VHPYEWALLRVVPRVDRGEFVNVGVLLYCRPRDYLGLLLTDRLDRALALDPDLDLAAVTEHLAAVREVCSGDAGAGANGARPAGERFRWLVAPRSTVVQPSPVHTGLTADPAATLTGLFERLVAATGSPLPDRD
jgi:hypothetical protein